MWVPPCWTSISVWILSWFSLDSLPSSLDLLLDLELFFHKFDLFQTSLDLISFLDSLLNFEFQSFEILDKGRDFQIFETPKIEDLLKLEIWKEFELCNQVGPLSWAFALEITPKDCGPFSLLLFFSFSSFFFLSKLISMWPRFMRIPYAI